MDSVVKNFEYDKFKNNKSGAIYQLLLISNVDSDRDDFPLTFTYQDLESGKVYSRPASIFLEKNTEIV